MAFRIGQVVELDAAGLDQEALLQTGDRGTVIKEAVLNEVGALEARILWHRGLRESRVVIDRLRLYVNPMDVPRRAQGSFETMQALRVVLQEEEGYAMEKVRRDFERACMSAEDLRGAMIARYDGATWRAFALSLGDRLETAVTRAFDDHAGPLAARIRANSLLVDAVRAPDGEASEEEGEEEKEEEAEEDESDDERNGESMQFLPGEHVVLRDGTACVVRETNRRPTGLTTVIVMRSDGYLQGVKASSIMRSS